MNEAHSPLPWSVDNGGVFKDANGDYVGGILFDESADEKFFVRAVNTHAALVEALKFYAGKISDESDARPWLKRIAADGGKRAMGVLYNLRQAEEA